MKLILIFVALFGILLYPKPRVPVVEEFLCHVEPGYAYKVTRVDNRIYEGRVSLPRQKIEWSSKCDDLRWSEVVRERWYHYEPVLDHLKDWLEKEKVRERRLKIAINK